MISSGAHIRHAPRVGHEFTEAFDPHLCHAGGRRGRVARRGTSRGAVRARVDGEPYCGAYGCWRSDPCVGQSQGRRPGRDRDASGLRRVERASTPVLRRSGLPARLVGVTSMAHGSERRCLRRTSKQRPEPAARSPPRSTSTTDPPGVRGKPTDHNPTSPVVGWSEPQPVRRPPPPAMAVNSATTR